MIFRYGNRTRPSTTVSSWLNTYPGIPLCFEPHLWLDAADTSSITSTSNAVSKWADKSGNGRDVLQSTTDQKPATNTTTVNNLNVLVFDGGDNLRSTGSTQLNVGDITVFSVFAETTSKTDAGILSAAYGYDSDFSSSNAFAIETAGSGACFRFARNFGPYATVSGDKPSAFGVYSVTANNSGFNQTYFNGATSGSTTKGGSWGIADSGFIVGTRYIYGSVSVSNGIIGYIGELIVYPRVLASNELTSVNNYLLKKWGIV